jgi:hypothetical protein
MKVGGFEAPVGSALGLGSMMKAAISEGSGAAVYQEEKSRATTIPFVVSGRRRGSITLQQGVAFELAQIVAQLVATIGAA